MNDRLWAIGEERREGKSDEQRAMSDLPLPPPEGDTSEEAVGRGPRARRFSDCSGNSPYNIHFLRKFVMAVVGCGFQPFRRVDEQREGNSDEQRGCRERFPTVPQDGPEANDLPLPPPERDTTSCTPA